MNRGQFFKGILALVGFQAVPMPTQEYFQAGNCRMTSPDTAICVPLKEGEEYCPLGHAQKPQIKLVQQVIEVDCMTSDGKTAKCPAGAGPLEQRVCATCGIVYVKQEKP